LVLTGISQKNNAGNRKLVLSFKGSDAPEQSKEGWEHVGGKDDFSSLQKHIMLAINQKLLRVHKDLALCCSNNVHLAVFLFLSKI